MKVTPVVALGELMASRVGSVDPTKFPGEVFDLYSIPAFDRGAPEVAAGTSIGSSKQIVRPGDVLLSKIVPHIRRTWVVGSDRGRRLIASGEWIVFRSDRVDQAYLRHVLVGNPFHSQFMQTVSGVGGSLLRARPVHVAKITVPLPPIPEQRRIAAILDQADALRGKRREALAQLDSLTQSIFIEMFGDPVASSSEWKQVQLSDVSDIVTGFAFKSEEYVDRTDSCIKLCRGANVLPGRLDWDDLASWPASKMGALSSFELRVGDIVMAMDRPWISEGFKVAQISSADCPSLLVQRVARLRGQGVVSNDYLYHLLNHPAFTAHCRPTETTVPHISPKEIRSFQFRLPPSSLQRDFVRRISCLKSLRAFHFESRKELDALFASLQHRAFRGEL